MPNPTCVYCGCSIQRHRNGRPATAAQLKEATAYHHPRAVSDTHICDTHRLHPPTSTSQKRDRSPSLDSSHSSSDHHPTSKRQRVAQILSSLSQPQQQPPAVVEQQAAISTVESATLTSTSSSQSVTTSMSISQDDDSDVLSNTTNTTSPSSLVHPYEQALAQSKQPFVTSSSDTCTSSAPSSSTVPPHQWKQFHDQLCTRVLLPNSRNEHMTHVITSSEHEHKAASTSNTATASTGRYLNVFDVHTHHDSATPETNIIQQLQATNRPHLRSTSQQSSSSICSQQRLRQTLSFNSSYTQDAYCQYSVTCSSPQPVVENTTISRDEAYARLVKASKAASSFTDTTAIQRISQQQNVFMPTINIDSIKNDTVKQRVKAIATAVQHQYKLRTASKHLEIECDHVFVAPLDGFGIDGVQLYLKSGECVTWLHDELLWCSAINYMMRESIGCALWIAIGLHDLKQVMSVAKMDAIFRRPQEKEDEMDAIFRHPQEEKDMMEIGTLLDDLISKRIHMEYVIQKPGQGISSPPGVGAAHLVFAEGILMSQLAWNYSFTMPGAIDCLAFWGGHDNKHGHLSLSNGSMATRSVLPLYTMQVNGYDFNLADQVKHYQKFISHLKESRPKRKCRITVNPDTHLPHCTKCLFRQDWIRINSQCIHCYYKKYSHALK